MAKNPQFSLDSLGGGAQARSAELAIGTQIVAIATVTTRITKISIKAITIR
ncbi:hypothetical protein [Candidatus Burkholderia verschuerenii]|uniref:hypothetical protein n=1 Tax=Candidatus Burkholderia verschuerenii TaxID=242163 RepID=UPI000B0930A8|nr:hypothetical protein [Candidatus Burkholderia verschuerenii]